MLHRLKCGTTTENNQWRLPEGVVTWDREAKQLRLHNGQLPGGFAVQAERAYEPKVGPGSQSLKAGDLTWGFYGEVPASEFFTASELAGMVGLTAGKLLNNTTPWLKFSLNGKTLFTPKVSIRTTVSWQDLYQLGLVYGIDGPGPYPYPANTSVPQNATASKHTDVFKVRLIKGANQDPYMGGAAPQTDPPEVRNSEWNRLWYPVARGRPATYTGPVWADYSDSELNFDGKIGAIIWCQETDGQDPQLRMRRGWSGVSTSVMTLRAIFNTNDNIGWRPVLELIA